MTITTGPPAAETATRAGYAAGMRRLADILDEHPEVPVPVDGHLGPLVITFTGENAVAKMTAASAVIPCEWTPLFRRGSHGVMLALEGRLDGLRIHLTRYLGDEDDSLAEYATGRVAELHEVALAAHASVTGRTAA